MVSSEKKQSKVRVGIDVGGTFTHAVAIDADTLKIVGRSKLPTTHRAKEGVARGIIDALSALLKENDIGPERVGFIAHSTTQATNALLEGDVAKVGIIGMGSGSNAWLAEQSTRLGRIELAPGKFLETEHVFVDTSTQVSDEELIKALKTLTDRGCQAIAISEQFSVDDTKNEQRVLALAKNMNLLATAGSDVSQLYGLKVRTRTAVINASMLPKMIESADMTESSVRGAGITAPVMIMRSDGGVMDIDAMRRKPILTMLSGPAAGVAAAMMFLRISDGVFLEVGGTSTDISAISNGRAQVRSGEIGGHKVYMRTLDVRTVGVAGGSMARLKSGQLHEVGPRSAHIAGLGYVAFTRSLSQPAVKLIKPLPQDPDDYVAISEGAAQPSLCLTPTCAANLLGLVPEDNCASGNKETISQAMKLLAASINKSEEEAAKQILLLAAKKCIPVVKALIKDHKLDAQTVNLIGGGGGAAAIVPFVAQELGMRHTIAEHADIISAIGVALALIRETVERQIINPTNEDILRMREEAHVAVEKMGATPDSIEVHVEIDARTNTVRATAFGATSMTDSLEARKELTAEEALAMAAESMRVDAKEVTAGARTKYFTVLSARKFESHLFGLLKSELNTVRVVDSSGSIRLQCRNAQARLTTAANADATIAQMTEDLAHWGDAGKVIPDMILLAGPKIIDLSGLLDTNQVVALAKTELETMQRDAQVIALAKLQ